MKNIKACIFDMDGVIVDSAKYHYLAWKRLANNMGFEFTEADNERLKGVSRMESLNIVLEIGKISLPDDEKEKLCIVKNDWFNEFVDTMTPNEILPGVLRFFEELKKLDIKIALGSASKNAGKILRKIEMLNMFDAIVDGTNISKAKPDPEVFLEGARLLNVEPQNCIVFEDAEAGVEAAIRGGMYCIGIGDSSILKKAHLCYKSFDEFDFVSLINNLK